MRISRFIFEAVAFAGTLLAASVANATEPQVAFVVKDGWVSMKMTRDEKPVPDAEVRVYDEHGGKFGEGETGSEGQAEFPLPPGRIFRLEIKTGDRTADIIQLTKVDDQVMPANVLLSFGLAPCCRALPRNKASTSPGTDPATLFGSVPVWMQAGGSMLFTILGVTIFLTARRSSTPTDRPLPEETP